MIDALMALVITVFGVLAMLALMPQGWLSSRTSDERSRAAMIMHSEFENAQALLSNPCNAAPGPAYLKNISSSLLATVTTGAETLFTVTKTFALSGVSGTSNIWTVTVQVVWPGTSTGVSGTHQVIQQVDYTFPGQTSSPTTCVTTNNPVVYN